MASWEYEIFGDTYQIDGDDERQADTKAIRLKQQLAQTDPSKAAQATLAMPADQREKPSPAAARSPIDNREGSGGMAGLTSAVEGMPITGPYASKLVEYLSSQIGSALTGEDAGKVRSEMSNMIDRSQEANPITSTTGKVGGAMLGTLPMIAALPEAFGAGAGSLLTRMLMGSVSGGTIGGTDAAVRGEDPISGATWGGGLGMVVPGGGQVVGSGVRALVNNVGGGSQAEKALTRALTSDGVTDPGAALNALGDGAMPMDLGSNLKRQAGALASTPGEGQQIVRSAIGERDAGANQRVQDAINQNLGPAVPPSQITGRSPTGERLGKPGARRGLTGIQEKLGPEYERALQGSKAADTEAIANDIQSMIVNERGAARTALQGVLNDLSVIGTNQLDPSPRALLNTRHALDGAIGDTQDTNVQRVLTNVRKKIDTELARVVPNVKAIDQKYERLAKQIEAVDEGQKIFSAGRESPWPQELSIRINEGGPVIKGRLAQGARSEIERIVGNKTNDRVALRDLIKGDGDWGRQKLTQLFGKDKADGIISVLDREATFADTSQVVTRNSETAARQAAQKDVTVPEKKPGFLRSAANLQFGEAGARVADRIGTAFRGAGQDATNTELAQLLTSSDPQSVTRVIKLVQAAQRRGDIGADAARQLIQSMSVAGAQQGRERLPVR